MRIQPKLTGVAMVGATWVMPVVAGLSAGGVAVAIARVFDLVRASVVTRRLALAIRSRLDRRGVEG